MSGRLAAVAADLMVGKFSPTEAVRRAAELPGPDESGEWLSDFGWIVKLTGSVESDLLATDLFEVVRSAMTRLENPIAAWFSVGMAESFMNAGRISLALRSLATATTLGDPADAATTWAWYQRLRLLKEAGRAADAFELVGKARQSAEASGSETQTLAILQISARLLRLQGRGLEAISAMADAVACRRAMAGASPPIPALRRLLIELGELNRSAGRYDAAILAFDEARTLALAEQDVHIAAYALSEVGYTWRNAGEVERGTALLQLAAEEAAAIGDRDNAARWRGAFDAVPMEGESPPTTLQRAASLLDKDPEAALTIARQCVKTARKLENPDLEAAARNLVGAAHSRLGNTVQALAALQAAEGAAIRSGDMTAHFHTLANMADEMIRHYRREDFLTYARRAVEIGEKIRRNAGSGETRQVVGVMLATVYDRLAMMSAVTYSPFATATAERILPDPAATLDTSQRMRARNLLRWLSARTLIDQADEVVKQRILALRAADVRLEARAGERETLLREAIDERINAEDKLRAGSPGEIFDALTRTDPILYSIADLAACLDHGECLVDVQSLMDGLIISCVTADGRASTGMFNGQRADRTAALVEMRRCRQLFIQDDAMGRTSDAEVEYLRATTAIQPIVTDVADEIRALGTFSRIYISPQTELFALPWWRLTTLLGDVELCILPAPGALVLQRGRQRNTRPLEKLVLVPDASGTLRYAEADVTGLRHQTVEGGVPAILDAIPHATTIHFACHGHFNRRNAYYSGFLVRRDGELDQLARPDPEGRAELCLLTAAQLIARTDVPRCDLAVLAACTTGIPRQHAANEFTSLPSAFLMTGARAVFASLWNTNDAATTLLMQDFYRELGNGHRPATAIAKARRTLAALDRATAVRRLESEQFVPRHDHPFSSDVYTDTFQFYGVE
jgi:tetratricopeptide (TPR) repeat protein